MKRYKFFIIFLILTGIFYYSCKVGLGSAVDTEAPTLSITYPQAAAVIKGQFVLAGVCKDDVKVASVEVTLQTTGGEPEIVGIYKADVDNDTNTWKISLNDFESSRAAFNGWALSDGGYVAQVIAKDDSGRSSGTSSLSFTIDNTAPLFILNSPGTSNINYPTQYGSFFKIAGTIADDNVVSSLKLTVYPSDTTFDENGNADKEKVAEWIEENIETVGGTEIVFANAKTTNQDLKDKYAELYATSDTGNKKFKLKLEVCDSAKEYTDPSEVTNTTKGNETSNFYFYDDVYDKWLSSSSGMDASTVKKVMNGTSDAINKEEFDQFCSDKVSSVAAFSVNPNSNPTYKIMGMDVSDSDWPAVTKAATGGGTITVNIEAGLDGTLIDPHTIRVVQFGPFDKTDLCTELLDDIYNITNYSFDDNDFSQTDDYINSIRQKTGNNGIVLKDGKDSNESSAASFSYGITLPDSLTAGKKYLLWVVARDMEKRCASPGSYYSFYGYENVAPPVVKWAEKGAKDPNNELYINSAEDNGIVGQGTLTFSGYVDNPGGPYGLQYVKYSIVPSDQKNIDRLETITGNTNTTIIGDIVKWNFTLPGINVENKEYVYNMTVTAKNLNGLEATATRKIFIDTKKPEITISSVSPMIEEQIGLSTRQSVNGTIKLIAGIDETNLSNVTYKLISGTNTLIGTPSDLGAVYSINKEIDTTGATDETDFRIEITATDKAGNSTTTSTTEWLVDSGISTNGLYLDQKTDNPVITGNNFLRVISQNNLAEENQTIGTDAYGNIFDTASNNKLMGTVTDDDGLQNVTVTYYDTNGTIINASTFGLEANPVSKTLQGTTSYSLNTKVPNAAGAYKVKIEAIDNTQNHKTAVWDNFYIGVDSANPTITETQINSDVLQYLKAENTVDFGGIVNDDWGVKQVLYSVSKDGSVINSGEIPLSGSSLAWTYSFDSNDYKDETGVYDNGEYAVKFTVKDKAGKEGDINRRVYIDTVAPEFTFVINSSKISSSYTDTLGNVWYGNSQIPVKVLESLTDVESVELSTDNTSWSSFTPGTKNGGSTEWTAYASCVSQGENTIFAKVIDKAGNETVKNITVYVDTEGPATCELDLVDGAVLSGGTKLVNGLSNVTLSLKNVSDACTGVSSVKITKIKDTLSTPIIATGSDSSWSLTISKAQLKDGGVTVTVIDGVGNKSDFQVFQLLCDTKYPKVSVSNISDADVTVTGVQINGVKTISGTASDNQTLKQVQLQYSTNGTTWNDYGSPITEDIYNWSVDVNTEDTTKFTDGNTYYFRAIATDEAGNTGNSGIATTAIDNTSFRTVQITQDSDRPLFRFTTISLEDISNIWLKNNNTLYGVLNDDDGNIASFQYKTSSSSSWTTVNVDSSGNWSISGLNDGLNTLYFKVTDTEGTEFQTAQTKQPKLFDGTNTISTGIISLPLKVDTSSPQVRNLKYAKYNSETNSYGTTFNEDLGITGGKYTKFDLQLEAADANQIASVTASFNNGTPISLIAQGPVNDLDFHYWKLPSDQIIQLKDSSGNNLPSGSYNLSIVVTDGAGLVNNQACTVIVDNDAPVITFIEPSNLIGDSETIRGNVNSTCSMFYAVSRYSDNADSVRPGDTAVENKSTAWAELTHLTTSLAWDVDFNGENNISNGSAKLFKDYIVDLGLSTQADIENNVYTDITSLYVWTKAIDDCGNVSYKSQKVLVDPQGDRPSVSISYPTENMNLGGQIRIMGTATDNISAKNVWVQVDTNGNGVWDLTDQNILASNGYILGDMTADPTSSALNSNVANNGIKCEVKGASWNCNVNTRGELNPSSEGETNTVKFIVYATDEDLNVSMPASCTVKIDKGNPIFVQTELQLVQYVSGSSGTVKARQAYTDDMSIKGQWYLLGKITDETGISQIQYNGTTVISSTGGSYNSNGVKFTPVNEGGVKNYTFQVPIGNGTADSVGTDSITIVATEVKDSNPASTPRTFSVSYDNKAPVIETATSNTNLSTNIINSNGFYTFGAEASEDNVGGNAQTGVERVAFFFTRDLGYDLNGEGTNTRDLFDIMINHKNNKAQDNASGNMISRYNNQSISGLIYEDYLYWKRAAGTVDGAAVQFSSALSNNVHKGGLAKVNGIVYRIESVDRTNNIVSLSGEPGDGSNVSVMFAIANVIDNGGEKNGLRLSSTEGYGYGYYSDSSTDDGDLMIESFTKQGTSWIWDASVNSKNIPDGPVTLHIVAFDAAGNVGNYNLENCTVKNNAPRIAGMKVGTDQNGNGVVDEDEFITTYSNLYVNGYDTSGRSVTDVVLPVQTGTTPISALTIKGRTEVQPVLVGGNGSLKYTKSVATYNSNMEWNTPSVINATPATIGTGSVDAEATITNNMVLDITDFIGKVSGTDNNSISDGSYSKFIFTIGDSTPGRNSASEISNSATLGVVMNVALRDTSSATAKIMPFYWKSETENSLFNNSADYGHIELTEDVTNNTNISGNRPKVSGMIKVEGLAKDNNLLSGLNVQFGTGFGLMGTTKTQIASYNSATAAWTTTALVENKVDDETVYSLPAAGWASEIKKATYQEMLDAGYITAIPSDKEPDNYVPYTSQDYGHVVHWVLYLDTSKITGVAANNVNITVTSTDRGKPYYNGTGVSYTSSTEAVTGSEMTGGENAASEWTGLYTWDIVPYITKLYTNISDKAGQEFARSALGKYIVSSGESIRLYGFNLDGTSTGVKLGTTDLAVSEGGTDENGTYITVNVGTSTTSGLISASVGTIQSLNNINSNPKFVSNTNNKITACGYNCQANNTTNNRLNDDVSVWIWDMGYFLNLTDITSPMMSMDSKSNYYMSLGYGTPYMVVTKNDNSLIPIDYSWNKFHNTNVTYDDNGKLYAVAMNTDREYEDSARFVLYLPPNPTAETPLAENLGSRAYQTPSSSRRHLESAYNGTTGKYDITRVKNAKITTYTESENKVYLAMAYYDNNNTINPVKFRFGSVVSIEDTYSNYRTNITFTYNASITTYGYYSKTSNGTVNNVLTVSGDTNYDGYYLQIGGNYYKLTRTSYYNYRTVTESYYYTLTGYTPNANLNNQTVYSITPETNSVTGGISGSISANIAEGESNNPATTDSSYEGYHIIASKNTTKQGGQYAACGIVPSPDGTNGYVGVVTWYDAKARRLCYSYNTNPDSAVVGDAWQTNAKYLDGTYTGWYVDMKVDAAGGIHIAYYNSAKGDLKYVYLSSYNAVPTTPVTVDSYLSTGTNITIDVRQENEKYIPYIYYFNASAIQTPSSIRVAWQNDTATLRDGAVDDKFTGAWEVMTIPTDNIPVDATVCGGVPTSGTWGNKVVLGYMSDTGYERAVLKK